MGIPVRLSAPQISEAGTWESAFITSTSRLVLPIDELSLFHPGSHDNPYQRILLTKHTVTDQIRERVLAAIRANSEPIL
jgi:hypothetical protein